MAMMRKYKKNIACLEGEWSRSPRETLSVRPLLDLVETANAVDVYYRRVATRTELVYHLDRLKSLKSYEIIYFSNHGDPGSIWLSEDEQMTLEDLAAAMGTGFRDRIIHFGACVQR